MKNLLIICLIFSLFSVCTPAYAQGNSNGSGKPDKKEWLQKMKAYKHEFLISELKLTEEQKADFFAVYDAKDSERSAAERSLRKMERDLIKKLESGTATDEELEKCITEQLALNGKLAEIDKKYINQLRKVLSKEQLFKLPRAERKFLRTLMENRHSSQSPKPKKAK